jgi:shikimate kinase
VGCVIALSGFMASGKSVVGRRVGELLSWPFVDLDELLEARLGRSIADVFRDQGEAAFRRAEATMLVELLSASSAGGAGANMVLSLGGGTVTTPAAAAALRESAHVVWLKVDAQEAWARTAGSGRPLAADRGAFKALAVSRAAAYGDTADFVVDTAGLTVEEVARRVVLLVTERTDGCEEHET